MNYDELQQTVEFLTKRVAPHSPTVGLILGSGLGAFADRFEKSISIDYGEIPHFPRSTVRGHAGKLVIGEVAGVACIAMQGRVHYYEGLPIREVVLPTRSLVALGASTIIVTNAAGGIREDLSPGCLMLIRDHINLIPDNPLRGPNDPRLGPRFPDMTVAYSTKLREMAHAAAAGEDIDLAEGVYAAVPGPTYETPAEVRMLQTLGADATGMSTVPEVIAARHMGASVLGISCITNKAAGKSEVTLTHDHVTTAAKQVQATFETLLVAILNELHTRGRPPTDGKPQ